MSGINDRICHNCTLFRNVQNIGLFKGEIWCLLYYFYHYHYLNINITILMNSYDNNSTIVVMICYHNLLSNIVRSPFPRFPSSDGQVSADTVVPAGP